MIFQKRSFVTGFQGVKLSAEGTAKRESAESDSMFTRKLSFACRMPCHRI